MTDPFDDKDSGASSAESARRQRKARQILAGAGAVFFEEGFSGAGTDEIARRAGVSKGTIYSYFPTKEALFSAFIRQACADHSKDVFPPEVGGDTRETLRSVARSLVQLLNQPVARRIFRLALAESERFPKLARAFYDAGPGLGAARMRAILHTARSRGDLAIDDVELAAAQFQHLCHAEVFYAGIFELALPDAERAELIASEAVETFYARYGVR